MKLLLIGPLPNPVTGVAIANQTVVDNYEKYTNKKIIYINTNYEIDKNNIGKFNIKKVYESIKTYIQIYKIFKVNKVYMTIGQTFFGVVKYLPYFLFSKILRKEIIIHIHGNHLWKEYDSLNGFRKKLFFSILKMSNKGIVSSQSLDKNLTPFLNKNKIYRVSNFVEDFLFIPNITKELETLKIVYMSHLTEEKGILDLLEALILLDKNNIDFKAKIAGSKDVSIAKEIDEKLKLLRTKVDYIGEVGKNRKELLLWSNIFILPTYYAMEGQPLSILEAMALGNGLLLTKHAGIPDIFRKNINGFYIEKKSPISIVNQLVYINNNISILETIKNTNIMEAKNKYQVETYIKNLNLVFGKK